ncbi:MAG TPA: choice-of-anchor B family protein [Pyrinomonadaceae bacterium]|nr:choice-of-anchor B family protein [Pyrinomonadaceae bacterium]
MKRKPLLAATVAALAAFAALGWSSLAHEGEHHSPGGNGQPGNQQLTPMGPTPCVNGRAGTFPCRNIDLASFLPIEDLGGGTANDIWGWTDPQTGKEYALLGRSGGVSFVDISDPEHPVYLGNLPTHTVDSLWRGLKVYRDHLFVVSEAADHGMQVFDLRRLRSVTAPPETFEATRHYAGFGSAHTLAVNEATGYAYAAGSRPGAGRTPGVNTCSAARGLHIVNIRNPAAPAFAGCVDSDGYTHETLCVVYRGPDAAHRGREICFNSNEDTLTIVDVTDKRRPAQLSRTEYEGRGYTHQGWLTEDQAHFILDDELDEQRLHVKTRTFVWDVADLDAPRVRGVYQAATTSIDHNLYVRGRYAFESNYRSGLRVVDLRNVSTARLSEAAFFDVYPADDQPLFNGTWSNYPFFASGIVIASGIEQGLFVLRPRLNLPVRIDYSPFFVRQHYLDFLGREPDEAGRAFWTFDIDQCWNDAACRQIKRVNVSAAFFLSIEFQETGYLVYRVHKAAYGDLPGLPVPVRRESFVPETRRLAAGVQVGVGNWQARLEANKAAYLRGFVASARFRAAYTAGMTPAEFVAALDANTGNSLTPGERDALAAQLAANNTDEGRALVLRRVAENAEFSGREFRKAFVLMQYFGYLRRNPNDPPDSNYNGYLFWLGKLNDNNGDFVRAEMVRAFIESIEYRRRFGQ